MKALRKIRRWEEKRKKKEKTNMSWKRKVDSSLFWAMKRSRKRRKKKELIIGKEEKIEGQLL